MPEAAPIEVPVAYGGDGGPDLDEVARRSDSRPTDVIDRHAERDYRVFMLGFMPGFAYMGSVDETIAAPRRATPRVRVPAGSVGIAGAQTGVYPFESPGGWQIIGRTPLRMFDVSRDSRHSVRLAIVCDSSTRAREVPRRFIRLRRVAESPSATSSADLTVIRPGLFTTIQDGGRWGYQASGVPVAGAMDLGRCRVPIWRWATTRTRRCSKSRCSVPNCGSIHRRLLPLPAPISERRSTVGRCCWDRGTLRQRVGASLCRSPSRWACVCGLRWWARRAARPRQSLDAYAQRDGRVFGRALRAGDRLSREHETAASSIESPAKER